MNTSDVRLGISWVAFGAGVVGQSFAYWNWEVLVYAILSLTLVRMLPIFLSLAAPGRRIHNDVHVRDFRNSKP